MKLNRSELENLTNDSFKKICQSFGLIQQDKSGLFRKTNQSHMLLVSPAQLRTQGIYDNKFEFSIGAACSIFRIEDVWKDLYYLTRSESEFTAILKDLIPTTYGVNYSVEKIKEVYPSNIRNSGWLCFETTKNGIKNFEEVISFIIENCFIQHYNNPTPISELDRNVNSKIELDELDNYIIKKDGFIYRRIIIAKLNNNPLFEDICNYQRQGFLELEEISRQKGYQHFKNIPKVFEEVYRRLTTPLSQPSTNL